MSSNWTPVKGDKGKPWGHVSPDGKTFRTYRAMQSHLCRKYDGYGIQAAVLDLLRERGVEVIELLEALPSGRVVKHRVPVQEWVGVRDVLREQDGVQVFMRRSRLPVWRELQESNRRENRLPWGLP